ncbi:ATP synthase F1 subunit delta [Aquimarina agarivorans]|uniref:ATP synthase F1 subunit delta n=1 Tax=Aquimarina agarivorans TaxID=980584 RepID=UPI000248ED4B|nr:ATP synthase F1 subunit delta [Aquimarina agarivorans]
MSRAAVRYAKAILDLAKQQEISDTVFAEMQTIKETVAESKDLRDLLVSPLVKAEVKKSVLKAVFANSSTVTTGLFDVLVDNKRVQQLPDVALSFIALYEQDKGSQVAIVTTAVPLTEVLEKEILAKVKELTGKDAALESVVDENIIGGFILRIGDLEYNASVAGQLAGLKMSFNDTSYVSKL